MTPYLDALAHPPYPGWPEPSAQTKATTETLLAALMPLLDPVRPYVGSGSHSAHYIVDVWHGDRELSFYVVNDEVSYIQSDQPEGGEWAVPDGLLKDDDGKLRELVAWLLGAA